MKRRLSLLITLLALSPITSRVSLAWDYEGHRLVNRLALASLPTNFPAFVQKPAAAERVAFLAGEPDRWRNTPDLPLKHFNEPDHYIDVEELALYGMKPETLPMFRDDFIAQLALVRSAHPESFPAVDPTTDKAHTRQLVGLLPWAIAENYGKLKSGFSYLKAFESGGGTAEEIVNAQENILYVMGVMGHYVGDAAQPLHTTIHHHGWVGDNPQRFSTNRSFHSWIDGGYFRKIHGANFKEMQSKLRPAQWVSLNGRPAKPDQVFQAAMSFIVDQRKMLEPLYQLDKEGKLSGDGEEGLQGRAFLESQLVKGGQMLGDIWYSAWEQAPQDAYLTEELAKRSHIGTAAEKK
jgi:hypothetical protein